jgi:hypothetical protein
MFAARGDLAVRSHPPSLPGLTPQVGFTLRNSGKPELRVQSIIFEKTFLRRRWMRGS